MYVDVHTHLTHEKFNSDCGAVIMRARAAGLGAIVVNGLDPSSNRAVLELAAGNGLIVPALGLYPVHAVNSALPDDFVLDIPRFPVADEIAFIRAEAAAGRALAIGECGLDGHWPPNATFAAQEAVFAELIAIALDFDLPLIVHTRKRELRAIEMLSQIGARKVVLHCFGGPVALAREAAEKHGWWLSIPANARVNQAFQKMLRVLPLEKILTETDAPYLAPRRGERNEPANVVGTVSLLAELRGMTPGDARDLIWKNYQTLFQR